MARREYRASFKCAEPGCPDTQFLVADTRDDEAALYKQQKAVPYRCTRHKHPEQNLRPGNESTRHVLVATQVNGHLSWRNEGRSGSGFTFGPGFNAHASDFPEGTRLVVTAEIQLPEDGA